MNTSYAQNYEFYYLQCNKADSLRFHDKNIEALSLYKSAFQSVHFIHTNKLLKAYELAIETNSYEDAYFFGKNILLNTGNKELTHTNSRKFRRSNFYQSMMDSSFYFQSDYKKRINQQYIKIIDSLVL